MALWCMKEAVVKAKGTGINAPPGLKGFTVGEHQTWHIHPCTALLDTLCVQGLLDPQEAILMLSMVGFFLSASDVTMGREVSRKDFHGP